MERLSDRLFGVSRLKITGVEPFNVLNEAAFREVEFWGAEPIDELTLEVSTYLRDSKKIMDISNKMCCEAEVIERVGVPVGIKKLRRRIALVIMSFLLFFVLMFSGLFIWQIDIVGNETISETEIRCVLKECGLHTGSFYLAFNENMMRNEVLLALPKLRAASICVRGSRATVTVRERVEIPDLTDEKGAEHIVAQWPGVLEDVRAFRGRAQMENGQTVTTGEILISGAVDSTYAKTTITEAEGEVRARTWYEITAIAPLITEQKCYTGDEKHRFALRIGNKRLNFYGNSGIYSMKCDNIITEHRVGIEDVFSLPVSFICITIKPYETVETEFDENAAFEMLEETLMQQLIHGIGENAEIISTDYATSIIDNTAVCTLRAECRQNIADKREMTAEEITLALADKEEETTE